MRWFINGALLNQKSEARTADACQLFLCVHRLRHQAAAKAGQLLRLLPLRLGAMSADSSQR
jgi:hypothetical protein